jgi:hypothetical protein
MTIQEKAEQLSKLMGTKTKENGETIIIITAEDGTEDYETMLNLTFKVSEATNLSMDSVYSFTYEALQAYADADDKDIDDVAFNLEADVYTGALTAWLSENVNHVYYLTEALQEYQPTNGFSALTLAQQKAKSEVAGTVLEYLNA